MTTTTSRRAILAGAAMLPAASLPALAVPAFASDGFGSGHPDIELLRLGAELEQVEQAWILDGQAWRRALGPLRKRRARPLGYQSKTQTILRESGTSNSSTSASINKSAMLFGTKAKRKPKMKGTWLTNEDGRLSRQSSPLSRRRFAGLAVLTRAVALSNSELVERRCGTRPLTGTGRALRNYGVRLRGFSASKSRARVAGRWGGAVMSSTTSRRALLTAAAAIPVAALPVLAAPALAVPAVPVPAPLIPSVAPPPAARRPTKIDALWEKFQAAEKAYKAADRQREKLHAELKRLMPLPHRSIVYGPENDADGLRWLNEDREPSSVHRYITPHVISYRLNTVGQVRFDASSDTYELAIVRAELTADEIALKGRLEARLELSKQYAAKLGETRKRIGLDRLDKKIEDRLLPRLSAAQRRIYAAPIESPRDLKRKLVLYRRDWNENGSEDGYLVEYLLRDLQRYADRRGSMTTQEFVGAIRGLMTGPEDDRLRFVADLDANPIA